MKKFALLITVLFMFSFVGLANALVMNFDDLSFAGAYDRISNYNGFTFNNRSYVMETDEFSVNSGYQNGVVSPNNVLFTGYAGTIEVSLNTPFELNSMYLTSAWNDEMSVLVCGFDGNNWFYESVFVVDSTEPTQVYFDDWGMITAFSIYGYSGYNHGYSGFGTHVVIDNIDYTITAAPVPEPATIVLFGTGLMAFASFSRRKTRFLQKG